MWGSLAPLFRSIDLPREREPADTSLILSKSASTENRAAAALARWVAPSLLLTDQPDRYRAPSAMRIDWDSLGRPLLALGSVGHLYGVLSLNFGSFRPLRPFATLFELAKNSPSNSADLVATRFNDSPADAIRARSALALIEQLPCIAPSSGAPLDERAAVVLARTNPLFPYKSSEQIAADINSQRPALSLLLRSPANPDVSAQDIIVALSHHEAFAQDGELRWKLGSRFAPASSS
jgi:hypothetical protein